MRKSIALVAFVVALGTASIGQAGVLWDASLRLQAVGLPAVTFAASLTYGTTSFSRGIPGAEWSVPSYVVGDFVTQTGVSAALSPISAIEWLVNGNPDGAFFEASHDASMLMTGALSFEVYGGITLLGVPLALGAPTVVVPPVVSGIGVTAVGNSWTTKTTTVNVGASSFTAMGSRNLVYSGTGTIVLVTSMNVMTSSLYLPSLPILGTLTLFYLETPEPVGIGMVSSGVAGLIALAWRRRSGRAVTRA